MSTKAKPIPSMEMLTALFRLDAENGVLLRARTWTNHKEGEVCGTPMASGHLQTCVERKRYMVHRIIYFMATGVDPLDSHVDHKDGDPTNNRPGNLRLATKAQNGRHRTKLESTNSSGHRNVSWSKRHICWIVSLTVNGKRIYQYFQELTDAVNAAGELRKLHYGEFSGVTL